MSNIPIIKSYKELVDLNSLRKSISSLLEMQIEHVSYIKNKVIYSTYTKSKQEMCLDLFLYDYVKNPFIYLTGKVSRLKGYDYSKLLLLSHPKLFMEQFNAYINNLALVGESNFTLWDFNITLLGSDIVISSLNSKSSEYLVIPYFVTKIGNDAFKANYSIKKIVFQEGSKLKEIGARCFSQCDKLKEINLPDCLEAIGAVAFYSCGFSSIEIPSALTTLRFRLFSSCDNLKKVSFKPSSKLNFIDPYVFEYSGIEEIELPSSLRTIFAGAFLNCVNLKHIEIPDSVVTLDECVFEQCFSLEKLVLGKGVVNIPEGLLNGCLNLKDITILGDIKTIGYRAFAGVKADKIIIPESSPLKPSVSDIENYGKQVVQN